MGFPGWKPLVAFRGGKACENLPRWAACEANACFSKAHSLPGSPPRSLAAGEKGSALAAGALGWMVADRSLWSKAVPTAPAWPWAPGSGAHLKPELSLNIMMTHGGAGGTTLCIHGSAVPIGSPPSSHLWLFPLWDEGPHEEQEGAQRAWQTPLPKLRSRDRHWGSATQHKIPQAF